VKFPVADENNIDPEAARAVERLARSMGESSESLKKWSAIFNKGFEEAGRRTTGFGRQMETAADQAEDLRRKFQSTSTTFESLQKTQSKASSVSTRAQTLFSLATGASTEASKRFERQQQEISSAVTTTRESLLAYEKSLFDLTPEQIQHKKELEKTLAVLKNQQISLQAVGVTSTVLGKAFSTLTSFAMTNYKLNLQYQGQYLSAMAAGEDGFKLLGLALTNAIDKQNAAAQAMGDFTIATADALGKMGGKWAPLAGLALGYLAKNAKEAANAEADLAKQGIGLLMQEGSKLVKTFREMTSGGAIFSNGMQTMIQATQGTKLRLEDMAKVVKEHSQAFAENGIGIEAATKTVGNVARMFASTSGTLAKTDRQLLALGFSYEEQAGLAAETLAKMKQGANGRDISDRQVAEATKNYAENLSLLKTLTGEEAKTKMDATRQANATLQFELVKQKMSATQRAELDAAMAKMTPIEQQNLRERMVYGAVVNKAGAILEAQMPSMKANGEAYARLAKNNELTVNTVAAQQAKTGKQTLEESKNMMGIARSRNADMKETQDAMLAGIKQAQATTEENVKAAKLAQKAQEEKAAAEAKKGGKDPTQMLLTAMEIQAKTAKAFQEVAVGKLGTFVDTMQNVANEMLAKLKAAGIPTGMGGPGTTLLEKILPYLDAIALVAFAVVGPMIKGMLNKFMGPRGAAATAESAIEKGAARPDLFKNSKGEFMNRDAARAATLEEIEQYNKANKKQGFFGSRNDGEKGGSIRDFFNKDRAIKAAQAEAKVAEELAHSAPAAAKELSAMSKGLKMVRGVTEGISKRIPVIGTLLAVGMAGATIYGQQGAYDQAKASGDKEGMVAARTEQAGAAGGAAGALILGGIGTIFGGPLGAVAGGIVGEFLGDWIGRKIGPSLDGIFDKISKWTTDIGSFLSNIWTGMGSNISSAWQGLKRIGGGMIDVIWGEIKSSWLGRLGQWIFDTIADSPVGRRFGTFFTEWVITPFQNLKDLVMDMMKKVYSYLPNVSGAYDSTLKYLGIREEKAAAAPAAAPAAPVKNTAGPANAGPAPSPQAPVKAAAPAAVGLPKKADLTADEKKNLNETIAANTKYTNDLLAAYTKNWETSQTGMMKLLQDLVSHASDTVSATKKVAKNTG
jgi:hypothetical protein